MLTSRPSRAAKGFSLVELLVAMAILGMLLALGIPSMRDYLANAKVRTMASNLSASLQFARTEAIRLNGGVDLVLTSDAPSTATVASPTTSTAGPHWMVRELQGTSTYALLEGRIATEGSQQAGGASPVVLSGSRATLSFSGLGGTGVTATYQFTHPGAGTCVADGGAIRCLNVQVSSSGQVRICDPAVSATSDPRHCS